MSRSSGATAPEWIETERDHPSPHPQPVVEIALRPEVLRRDEDAPAGPERPRQRDGPVGHVVVERDIHASGSPVHRQPRPRQTKPAGLAST